MKQIIEIGPDKRLTAELVKLVAEDPKIEVALTKRAKNKITASRKVVEKIVKEKMVVYGVSTGFGKFKDKAINEKDTAELQSNLIRSHATGVGVLLPTEVVRAIMLVRLNSLSQGYSGVRLELVETGLKMLNAGVIPLVPAQGSVGASGDLAPLSHLGLVLMGEGEAWYNGERLSGGEAMTRAGIKPIAFSSKEGLAWTNGTAFMTGIASLAFEKAKHLLDVADIACALTLEGVAGMPTAFDERIHKLREHPGQVKVAEHIRALTKNSKLVNKFPQRIQDSYTLRCAPQVHGAVRDAVSYVEKVLERELRAVTDNPLIFSEPPYAISGGNFHGQPLSISMDVLKIAISGLGNISERRTAKLVDSATNEGLPLFLIPKEKAGLHNGFMIPQYTAAALVSENKILSHPASVDSIPTSANQEDHVSMGSIAARKALEVAQNVENILAIELLTAAQAVEFRDPQKLGQGTKKAYKIIRSKVAPLTHDRILHYDIVAVQQIIAAKKLAKILENDQKDIKKGKNMRPR